METPWISQEIAPPTSQGGLQVIFVGTRGGLDVFSPKDQPHQPTNHLAMSPVFRLWFVVSAQIRWLASERALQDFVSMTSKRLQPGTTGCLGTEVIGSMVIGSIGLFHLLLDGENCG